MIRETALAALEPWVGRVAADTCVRATALSAGKDIDEFGDAEINSLCCNVRRLLTPIAPHAAVENVIAQIQAAGA